MRLPAGATSGGDRHQRPAAMAQPCPDGPLAVAEIMTGARPLTAAEDDRLNPFIAARHAVVLGKADVDHVPATSARQPSTTHRIAASVIPVSPVTHSGSSPTSVRRDSYGNASTRGSARACSMIAPELGRSAGNLRADLRLRPGGQLRPVDLARRHGLSTQAIRNYEAAGILPDAERTPHGYRT
jgi:hypothetical protein